MTCWSCGTPDKEVGHLRKIEDAERDLKRYHGILNQLIGGAVVLAGTIVGAAAVADGPGWPVAVLIIASVAAVADAILIPWWIWWNHSEPGRYERERASGPAERLREARRDYEDYLNAKAAKENR